MKLVRGVLLSEEDGGCIAVTVGEARKRSNAMFRLNATGGYIVNALKVGVEKSELVKAFALEYGVSEDVALNNVEKIVSVLEARGLIEE